MIHIPPEPWREIVAHAEAAYPNECCGALLGRIEGPEKVVLAVRELENAHSSPRAHYLIRPADLLAVAKDAAARELRLIGIYHSHVEAEAHFSAEDLANSWPWYSFVVLSVRERRVCEATSWLLERTEARREPLQL